MALITLVLGGLALLGLGWFSTSLLASVATPVSLILAGAAGATSFIKLMRQETLDQFFSTDDGLFIGLGLISVTVFVLTFAAAQSIITRLSPLAGIIVIGLGVAVFFAGPGILLDFLTVALDIIRGEK